ncbi:hypothetical protein BZG36_00264 [Bifiguratus adelaidae]|uniref:Major facilitator superfamily (MFS) profile domain-containing protein n=1 Tax=Bifiguratus adelaidae TaxID=1938954 RepID=A0A261Y855_9FUNG|nr:hypothetical protein BZG36_00264 [Bifiguratus adelaidae]
MGLFTKQSAAGIVGNDLARILPTDAKPWYLTGHLLKLNFLLLFCLLSSSGFGYDGSMMNALQSLAQWQNYFTPAANILGLLNAVNPLGGVFGFLVASFLSDRFGRRIPIFIGIVIIWGATALQAASTNVGQFIGSRFLIGVGNAVIVQSAPLLITELAYPTHRGTVTSLFWTCYYVGSLLSSWITYGTATLNSSWSWRIPSLLQAALPTLQFLGMFFVPESPRWLIAHDKVDDAKRILTKYHAGGDESSALVHWEVTEIQEAIRLESSHQQSFKLRELFRGKANRRRALISICMGIFGQWAGNGIVSYYLTLILDAVGITSTQEQTLINGILQIVNLGAAIFASFMVDRLGRRRLFFWSNGGMLASYIVITAGSATFAKTGDKAVGIVVVAFVILFNVHYDVAYTPLLIAYPTEIWQYSLRSMGISLTMVTTELALFFNLYVNPIALATISWRYYIVYVVILVIMFIVTYFLFPETKGYSLEEINQVFEGKKTADPNAADLYAEKLNA